MPPGAADASVPGAGAGGSGGATAGLGGGGGAAATGSGGQAGTAGVGAGGDGGEGGTGGAGVGGEGSAGGSGGDAGTDGGSGTGGAGGTAGTAGAAGTGGTGGGGAPDDNCQSGDHDGHTYWFCENINDWDDARGLCQAIGGDLVSINSEQEQNFLVETASSGEWLIGLNKKNASGATAAETWEWVDGTEVSGGYENWNSGEPDSLDCGVMNDGAWRDITCSNDENWICEVP